jgi:hypothetical protein
MWHMTQFDLYSSATGRFEVAGGFCARTTAVRSRRAAGSIRLDRTSHDPGNEVIRSAYPTSFGRTFRI